MKKKVLVLGCTGSIGRQALDIVRHMDGRFSICGLAAGTREHEVAALCREFGCPGTVFARDGMDGLRRLIAGCGADIAVNGIAGAAGLEPSALVLEQGIDLALANKETVVVAWPVIARLARESGASIIPVDSEHSAVFTLRNQAGAENISEIIITASGGPFRGFTREQLQGVTPEQALRHPTWSMGQKITVDSASLANKGLEVIEACRLFDVPPERVKVVVHPQSLVHSLVRTRDGMLYAQISHPDMRHPIFGALVWPEVAENYLEPFDLAGHEMTFYPPRMDDFPLLGLAYDCARRGGAAAIAFNAANEVAVRAFLERRCGFMAIPQAVEEVLRRDWRDTPSSLEQVLAADREARALAREALAAGGAR